MCCTYGDPFVVFRLRAPVNQLTTLDIDGEQNVFLREAPLTVAGLPTVFPGPGKIMLLCTLFTNANYCISDCLNLRLRILYVHDSVNNYCNSSINLGIIKQ